MPPDFEWRTTTPDADVLYVHRRVGEAEVYFLSNQKNRFEDVAATFRVSDRAPELFDPATGAVTRPGVFRSEHGRLTLPLRMEPFGSVFIVFREPLPARHAVALAAQPPGTTPSSPAFEVERTAAGQLVARCWKSGASATLVWNDGTRAEIQSPAMPEPAELAGPWQVSFPPNLGAPPSATFDKLVSLSEHAEPGIRFFSGTATYRTAFAPRAPAAGSKIFLDLGDVQVIAEVKLNGRDLGILWKPPFRVDVTGALQAGANELEIRVTSLWPNRMIGDAALPDDVPWNRERPRGAYPAAWPDWLVQGQPRPSGRFAFCTRKDVYAKDDPLLPSGLMGPVRLLTAAEVSLGGGK